MEKIGRLLAPTPQKPRPRLYAEALLWHGLRSWYSARPHLSSSSQRRHQQISIDEASASSFPSEARHAVDKNIQCRRFGTNAITLLDW